MDNLLQNPITFIIIALTCLTSYKAFEDNYFREKMLFRPYSINSRNEYYRFLTGGLIHADWLHLMFNMYALFGFGGIVEQVFQFNTFFGPWGKLVYVGMYFLAIIVACIPTYFNQRHNATYAALGASGAVSAIVFTVILLAPDAKIGFLFIPVGIPGYIFGLFYLAMSSYLSRRGNDNIGHDVHFNGALFGFFFPVLIKPELLFDFIEKIKMSLGIY